MKTVRTAFLALVLSLFVMNIAAAQNWQTFYQTDFSNEPYWPTNNPSRYYWDAGTQTFFTDNFTNSQDNAITDITYNGESFQLTFDVKPVRSPGETGDVNVGLFGPTRISNSSSTEERLYVLIGGYGDQVYFTGYNSGGENLYTGPGLNLMQNNAWHHVEMIYDSESLSLSLDVTINGISVLSTQTTMSYGFSSNLSYLGVSMVGSWVTSNRHESAYIDNVVFSLVENNPIDPLFQAAVSYVDGLIPISVFSADLDGDDDNDLAVANAVSDNVSILMNNGDGTFQAAANYPAGNFPYSVFSADLDGDGDNDLAVANFYSHTVSILINNGDGTFQAAVNYTAGHGPARIFLADLDGDGDNDLAVPNLYSDNVSIFVNNGDGTFQVAANYAAGNGPVSVFSADFDSDGDNDLVTVNENTDNVSILLNNGDGTFQAVVNYTVGGLPGSVFSADLDGDGDNDLAVANRISDNVSILMNNGDGTFQTAVSYSTGIYPNKVFSADFDGDGDNDLAVANYLSNSVSLLMNNGDGTFQAAVNYGVGGFRPRSLFSIDLDGDGDNDLATANSWSHTVSILLNTSVSSLAVHLDIKPGSCPNPLNVKASKHERGNDLDGSGVAAKDRPQASGRTGPVLPAAILGTVDFDVTSINPTTVTLEGVPVLRWNIEDVSTPVGEEAEECECTTAGPDGYPDLTLKFDRGLVVEALGEVYDGDIVILTVTGELFEGTPIEGTDCVIILNGDDPPDDFAASGESQTPALLGNVPNPFNPSTQISFSLSEAADVTLEIYNITGQKVATLTTGRLEAGHHSVAWDGSNAASGIYLYRLEAGDFVDTKKMVLLK